MAWFLFFVFVFCLFWLNPTWTGFFLCLALTVVFYFSRPVFMRFFWRWNLHKDVNPEIVSFLTKELQRFPLHQAVFYNDFYTVDNLLDQGYTVAHETDDGQTPLHIAAECNQPAMCRFLLKNGAEIDVLDNFGGSALHAAAACQSNPRVIKLLIKHGANPLLRDSAGLTPRGVAKKYNHKTIEQYLLFAEKAHIG